MRIGFGKRKLDALIFANRIAKDRTLIGIGAGFFDKPFGITNTFGSDQDTLGIHARKNIAEALALLPDEGICRNLHIIEKYFGGGVINHRADRANGDAIANQAFQIKQKHR